MSMFIKRAALLSTTVLAGLAVAGQAHASLKLSYSIFGNVDKATDGCGSLNPTCTLIADIPAGSKIEQAFLYSSTFSTLTDPNGVTIQTGAGLPFAPVMAPLGANGSLQAWRGDVTPYLTTNLVLGSGAQNLIADEGGQTAAIDGEALVIVYSNPSLPLNTAFVLDGFSASTGDTATIGISPWTSTSTAEMRLGIGFSFDGPDPHNPTNTNQVSTVTVNGSSLTTVAGHCDDAQDATCANGNLITVGGFHAGAHDDPFTPFPCNGLGCIGQDHERYDLSPVMTIGQTSIKVDTLNASRDDNIFLEVFDVSGRAVISTPEPGSLALLGVGLAGFGWFRRRRSLQKKSA